jgi:hypothetical protein
MLSPVTGVEGAALWATTGSARNASAVLRNEILRVRFMEFLSVGLSSFSPAMWPHVG